MKRVEKKRNGEGICVIVIPPSVSSSLRSMKFSTRHMRRCVCAHTRFFLARFDWLEKELCTSQSCWWRTLKNVVRRARAREMPLSSSLSLMWAHVLHQLSAQFLFLLLFPFSAFFSFSSSRQLFFSLVDSTMRKDKTNTTRHERKMETVGVTIVVVVVVVGRNKQMLKHYDLDLSFATTATLLLLLLLFMMIIINFRCRAIEQIIPILLLWSSSLRWFWTRRNSPRSISTVPRWRWQRFGSQSHWLIIRCK